MEQKESKHSIIAEYYTDHYDELKSYVASRLLYASEAEDVVQNVFVRLLQINKMITRITLPCLVYTIAKNLITDYWRHKNKVEEHEHYIRKCDCMSRYVEDGESVYSALEINEILERGIARLTPNQSKVYRMNIYDGMQVSEIAKTLHLNYKNAENRLGTARKEVRNYVRRVLAS